MKSVSLICLAATVTILTGCNKTVPDCPDQSPGPEVRSAGCLVINNKQLLVIREMTGKISIPGGSGDTGETGRCTAFRETWEETGLTVTAGELIRQFDNGFHLYRCSVTGDVRPDPEFTHEVREALWLNSASFDQYRWRFPEQKQWLKEYLLSQ